MRRTWFVIGLFVSACAADDSSGSERNAIDMQNSFGNAAGSSAGTGDFGNGAGTTARDPGTASADGGACETGKFCKPMEADSNNCGTLTLKGDAKVVEKPGNVLIIFDRSGSMGMDWNGMPRWQVGGGALIDALTPIADKLTVGAVLFPSPSGGGAMTMPCAPNDYACMFGGGGGGYGPTCDVNPITSADQVDFKAGAAALTELQSGGPGGAAKYEPVQTGGTPTSEAVAVADMSFAAAKLVGTTSAVLITDGEPNCQWNQATTVATIKGWLKNSIKTYVIGLPGAAGGNGAANLNALAQAGGTMSYIEPTDSMTLQMKLNEIVKQTVSVGFDSCTIHLDPAAMVPDKLQLVVTDKGIEQAVPHVFSGQKTDAWTISKDGGTVELLGQLCEDVKGGRFSEIRFTFGCIDLPTLPPPNPE